MSSGCHPESSVAAVVAAVGGAASMLAGWRTAVAEELGPSAEAVAAAAAGAQRLATCATLGRGKRSWLLRCGLQNRRPPMRQRDQTTR